MTQELAKQILAIVGDCPPWLTNPVQRSRWIHDAVERECSLRLYNAMHRDGYMDGGRITYTGSAYLNGLCGLPIPIEYVVGL
jgi:hypothetical protein